MGKKRFFGSDNIISIYKLMEICGLHCPTRGNIAVSHKIALRKLELRSKEKPGTVAVPRLVPFKTITNDEVRQGRILLVRDDCKNICGYLRPSGYLCEQSVSKIYDDLYHCEDAYEFEEGIEELEEKCEVLKPGEKKYIIRRQSKKTCGRGKVPKIDDLTSKDKARIRKRLIAEYKEDSGELKPGEIKYMKRKKLRKEGCKND